MDLGWCIQLCKHDPKDRHWQLQWMMMKCHAAALQRMSKTRTMCPTQGSHTPSLSCPLDVPYTHLYPIPIHTDMLNRLRTPLIGVLCATRRWGNNCYGCSLHAQLPFPLPLAVFCTMVITLPRCSWSSTNPQHPTSNLQHPATNNILHTPHPKNTSTMSWSIWSSLPSWKWMLKVGAIVGVCHI